MAKNATSAELHEAFGSGVLSGIVGLIVVGLLIYCVIVPVVNGIGEIHRAAVKINQSDLRPIEPIASGNVFEVYPDGTRIYPVTPWPVVK